MPPALDAAGIVPFMWFCMQLYPQSLDNERRLMMSRACCAGPSVPEGDNEHGVRKYRPYYSDCGTLSKASNPVRGSSGEARTGTHGGSSVRGSYGEARCGLRRGISGRGTTGDPVRGQRQSPRHGGARGTPERGHG